MYRSSTGKVERWFNPNWMSLDHIPKTPVDLPLLKVRASGWVGTHTGGRGGGTIASKLAVDSPVVHLSKELAALSVHA